MADYTPGDIIQLPRLTAVGAMALGEKILTAAKPHKQALPASIARSLTTFQKDHGGLKDAVRDQVAPPQADRAASVAADRDVDACWSALFDFLTGHEKLPGVPQAAEAGAIKGLIYTDGLRFTQLAFPLEWAESEAKIERMRVQKLDERIGALGGQLFIDCLIKAHVAYGKALGLTAVQAPGAAPPPSLRAAMDAFGASLRKYVTKVMASVEDDEPETRALADALLAPLATWDVGPTRSGAGNATEEPAPEGDPADPQPVKP